MIRMLTGDGSAAWWAWIMLAKLAAVVCMCGIAPTAAYDMGEDITLCWATPSGGGERARVSHTITRPSHHHHSSATPTVTPGVSPRAPKLGWFGRTAQPALVRWAVLQGVA